MGCGRGQRARARARVQGEARARTRRTDYCTAVRRPCSADQGRALRALEQRHDEPAAPNCSKRSGWRLRIAIVYDATPVADADDATLGPALICYLIHPDRSVMNEMSGLALASKHAALALRTVAPSRVMVKDHIRSGRV
eukprot:7196173-Prymnesium_polylepis.2